MSPIRLRLFSCFGIIFSLSLIFSLSSPAISSAKSSSCYDLELIFARGSGAPLGTSPDFLSFSNAMRTILPSYLHTNFYELGQKSQKGFRYPAVKADNLKVAFGAKISAGMAFQYGESVKSGVNELVNYLELKSSACSHTKFILAGYSQGASVISLSLPLLPADKIIYAATFGDPKLYLPEGKPLFPPACRGQKLSNYRIKVPDCKTYQGILSGLKSYQPKNFIHKLGAWCNSADFMCGSYFNLTDFETVLPDLPPPIAGLMKGHLSYHSDQSYMEFARLIQSKITHYFPPPAPFNAPAPSKPPAKPRDTLILLDTTGSMSNLISRFKTAALRLAKESLSSNGRIALYAYRDLIDSSSSYALQKLCDFSCDLATFKAKLFNITTGGGGDRPESALSASYHAMKALSWRKEANKSLVLLTDAPFHSPDRDGTTIKQISDLSLTIDPVSIFTITPSDLKDSYLPLVSATFGQGFSLSDQDFNLSVDYLLNRPVAALALPTYFGQPNTEFFFDASGSTGLGPLHYEWDLDFDGIFETKTTSPTIAHSYPNETSGFLLVKVIDSQNQTSTMSAPVTVTHSPPALPTITHAAIKDSGELFFTPSSDTFQTLISVNDFPLALTDKVKLLLTDLPAGHLTLTPISRSGQKGIPKALPLPSISSSIQINSIPLLLAPNTSFSPILPDYTLKPLLPILPSPRR